MNNSIKHQECVNEDLAKYFPEIWGNEGDELKNLAGAYTRLTPEVNNFLSDLVERVYALHFKDLNNLKEKDIIQLRKEAEEKNDIQAQLDLGLMYAEGIGVSQDYREAAKWYCLASELNRTDADISPDLST